MKFILIISFFLINYLARCDQDEFPKVEVIEDILYGVASSAYQIEGSWNADGRGSSIWDVYTHTHPELIEDHSNGDVACDSYNRLQRDLKMIESLGVDFYRFSISWSRILPTGFIDRINEKGLKYYGDLIDGLIQKNITPMVTIYHWDLPDSIQLIGGWTNEATVDYIEDYARVLFENFGARVPYWVTINEPFQICKDGYGSSMYAPVDYLPGVSEYLCMHNIIKAHARIYHLYKDDFRKKFSAQFGMSAQITWFEPKTDSEEDKKLALAMPHMHFGWAMNAVYSIEGDYPEVLRDQIDAKCKEANLTRSRLPKFTPKEIEYIQGTADFLGINYYNSKLVTKKPDKNGSFAFMDLTDAEWSYNPLWENTSVSWIKNYPNGLRQALNFVKHTYNNPMIFITENGCTSENGTIENEIALKYIKDHINMTYQIIREDGVRVKAYTVWTLMDNFEWNFGYTLQFGLYKLNLDNLDELPVPRKSAEFYKTLLKTVKAKRNGVVYHPRKLTAPLPGIASASTLELKKILILIISVMLIFL